MHLQDCGVVHYLKYRLLTSGNVEVHSGFFAAWSTLEAEHHSPSRASDKRQNGSAWHPEMVIWPGMNFSCLDHEWLITSLSGHPAKPELVARHARLQQVEPPGEDVDPAATPGHRRGRRIRPRQVGPQRRRVPVIGGDEPNHPVRPR